MTGLESAGILLAKGTIGVIASIMLAATTQPRDLLRRAAAVAPAAVAGADHDVHVPVRRGGRSARWTGCGWPVSHAASGPSTPDTCRVVAQSAGALFIRSYERGERVHLAMLSRGYTGRLPVLADVESSSRRHWAAGALVAWPRRSPTAAAAWLSA
ncbi:MAG: energy-coupling factor transporter transmembrane component T [Geodermatophilaceae bacterium]